MISQDKDAKHTAAGIPTWSPTVVLICRSTAYVWQSGRDAQFSADCGRMCLISNFIEKYTFLVEEAGHGKHTLPNLTILRRAFG
jgi:hypothetical protein